MTAADILRISDEADREQIVTAITALRAKQDRMPKHWVDRRLEIADDIDALVDQWLALSS